MGSWVVIDGANNGWPQYVLNGSKCAGVSCDEEYDESIKEYSNITVMMFKAEGSQEGYIMAIPLPWLFSNMDDVKMVVEDMMNGPNGHMFTPSIN